MTAAALAELGDEDLAEMYDSGGEDARAAALAEAARRDQEQAAKRDTARRAAAQRMRDTAWAEVAHAQMIAASEACRGSLLSRRGKAAGVSEWSLWTGPESRARAYASEELLNFWRDSPRVTVTTWRDSLAADRRDERDTASSEQLRTEKLMIGERIARAAIREAGRTPARDWAGSRLRSGSA